MKDEMSKFDKEFERSQSRLWRLGIVFLVAAGVVAGFTMYIVVKVLQHFQIL